MFNNNIISDRNIVNNIVKQGGAALGKMEELKTARDIINAGGRLPEMPARFVDDGYANGIVRSMVNLRSEQAEYLFKSAQKNGKSRAEKIAFILKKGSIQIKQSQLHDAAHWESFVHRINELTAEGQILVLPLLLGGGVVGSPLKTGNRNLPDVSEWIAWTMLGAMAEAISRVYSGGARVLAIPDASLHNADLGFAIEHSIHHLKVAQTDLQMLGLHNLLVIPNTLDYLPENWGDFVDDLTSQSVMTSHDYEITESLVHSMNLRAQGISYERLVLIANANAGNLSGLPYCLRAEAVRIFGQSEAVALHYGAVNLAIRQLDLVGRISQALFGLPGYLRLSVHAKALNGLPEPRPQLYPMNRFVESPALLPMHGVGVIDADDSSRFGITFDLKARIQRWVPLVWNNRQIGYAAQKDESPSTAMTVPSLNQAAGVPG